MFFSANCDGIRPWSCRSGVILDGGLKYNVESTEPIQAGEWAVAEFDFSSQIREDSDNKYYAIWKNLTPRRGMEKISSDMYALDILEANGSTWGVSLQSAIE